VKAQRMMARKEHQWMLTEMRVQEQILTLTLMLMLTLRVRSMVGHKVY
jgi:hypothetical protein